MIRRLLIATALLLLAACAQDTVELPARRSSGTLAVLISGDGGWRAIDRDIAASLNAAGVSVIGIVSTAFFSERKTPAEAAQKLDALLAEHERRWRCNRVILIGYSRGAGVLPFMVTRLSAPNRARICAIALLAPDAAIDFKVRPQALWGSSDELTIPLGPELRRLRDPRLLCIAGADDHDAICRSLPPELATRVLIPGGHHFGDRYRTVVTRVLAAARAPNPRS